MEKAQPVTTDEKILMAEIASRLNLLELVTLRAVIQAIIEERVRQMPIPNSN